MLDLFMLLILVMSVGFVTFVPMWVMYKAMTFIYRRRPVKQ